VHNVIFYYEAAKNYLRSTTRVMKAEWPLPYKCRERSKLRLDAESRKYGWWFGKERK